MGREALYTLEELAQAAQITPRAVRYYAAKGLLPAPQSRGRYALYGTAHLNRLRLIAQLKAALLPLATMRDRMLSLTDAQVAGLLARQEWLAHDTDAKTGVAQADMPPDTVSSTLEEQADAYQYLLDVLLARTSSGTSQHADLEISLPHTRRELFSRPAAKDQETGRQGEPRSEEEKQSRKEANDSTFHNPPFMMETWQRVMLAPGVELHIRVPQPEATNAKLEQLIAEAKSLFQP